MVNGIYTKSFLERIQEELPEWQRIAFEPLAETLADDADTFPCIPGRQAFLTDQLRIAFAGDPRENRTAEELAPLLAEYGKISRDTGKYASLVVLFDTPEDLAEHYSIEAYEELFWRFLNRLSHQDEKNGRKTFRPILSIINGSFVLTASRISFCALHRGTRQEEAGAFLFYDHVSAKVGV